MRIGKHNLIYIVDDDPDDRQLLLDAFLENNADIDYVFIETGKELVDVLHATKPEDLPAAILLDLNMPGMLGLHALKLIRDDKQYAHIPIIVITTSTFSQDESSSYKLGANCYIRKPHSFNELKAIAASVIKLWLSPVIIPSAEV